MYRRLFLLILALLIPVAVSAQSAPPPEIEVALADVNTRLGTSYTLNDLDNWSWAEQIFNDASLGCPQPDMAYAQVVTRGYVITLTIDDQIFDYRAPTGSGTVVFCAVTSTVESTPEPAVGGTWEYTAVAGRFNPYLAWSPSGTALAVSGVVDEAGEATGQILFYNPDDLEALPTQIPLDQPVTALQYSSSSDGVALLTGGGMGQVALTPVEPVLGEPLNMHFEQFGATVTAVAISPDGSTIASANASFNDPSLSELFAIHLWTAATGEFIRSIEVTAPITSLAFSPVGTELAAGTVEGTLLLVDYEAGEAAAETGTSTTATGDVITVVSYSDDGSLLAVGTETTVTVWDVTDPLNLSTVYTLTTDAPIRALAFAPDGTALAAAGGDPSAPDAATSTIRVWDLTSGEVSATLRGHTDAVNGLAFSPDGTRLASISFDGTLRVWEFGAVG